MKYEYKCDECENIWDEYHSIKVNDAVQELGLFCPECKSNKIKKYLGNYGTATVVFKGMGWAHKDMLMDKIGMPKETQNNPETRAALNKNL